MTDEKRKFRARRTEEKNTIWKQKIRIFFSPVCICFSGILSNFDYLIEEVCDTRKKEILHPGGEGP